MPVSRFAVLAGIPERTHRRRLARLRAGEPPKGPWPAPKTDAIEATRLTGLADLRDDRAVMPVPNSAGAVVGQASAPIAIVSDNGPCFRSETYAQAFPGHDPLLRQVRTRVRSPRTNGIVERFFGTLKYEHLYRAMIRDGDALSAEVDWFRQIYNTIRPHQALGDRTPRSAYLSAAELDI